MQPSSNKFAVLYKPETANQKPSSIKGKSVSAPTVPVLMATTGTSPCYRVYVLAIHALALAAVWLPEGLPWLVPFVAIPALLINAWQMLVDFPDTSTLLWRSNGQIKIQHNASPSGKSISGIVSPGSMQCYFCVLLKIKVQGNGHVHFLIPRDAVSVRDYRRLRSRLFLATMV